MRNWNIGKGMQDVGKKRWIVAVLALGLGKEKGLGWCGSVAGLG